MKVIAKEIKALKSPYLQFIAGDEAAEAYRPWPPEIAPPGALVFVSSLAQMETALEIPAGIIVAAKSAYHEIPKLGPSQALFLTPAIQAAMTILNPFFDTKSQRIESLISPLASIHGSAKLGQRVSVGPFAVIGANVEILDDSKIGPHCVVEKNAKIGSRTQLHSLVHVGADCEIGNDCEVHPHTCLGSDGFGFATDPQNINHKIPQLGNVIIEDDVEIGSNCSIDRGTLIETRIGVGTKLDNQVHIAHNCKIGKNCLITAGFRIAGSSEVGDNFKCGGGVLVADHVKICANVTVGGNSAVTKDISTPGAYTGYPLQPWREGLKMLASLANLPEMRRELSEIKQKLAEKNRP